MRHIRTPALGFALFLAAMPALAQNVPGMAGGAGNAGGVQPQPRVPDIAPPALPGAGGEALATGPVVQKPATGDPTAELFDAVNKGDYGAAQDAISRGADLNAQNTLGETPLDLSVALDRSTITFLLISARNENGSSTAGAPLPAITPAVAPVQHHKPMTKPVAKPAADTTNVNIVPPASENNPGTPNASAGFLGFSPKN